MKKVLITGGAGFIGYHLACSLSQNDYEIDLIDNFARGIKDSSLIDLSNKDNINLINLDLLDGKSLDKLSKRL